MLALDDNMIRGRRKPKESALFTREMRRALDAANSLSDGKAKVTHQMVSELAGVGRHTAQRALHILTYAKTIRAKTVSDDEALERAAFSDKSKLTIADAIRIHKERLDKSYAPRIDAEVRRRIDTADDHVRRQLKELQGKLSALERVIGAKGVFTRAEFRQLQMAVHPDNTASVEVRNRLLDILVRNEIRLVKEA